MKRRPVPKRRSVLASLLKKPKYRQRIKQSKKRYSRKGNKDEICTT